MKCQNRQFTKFISLLKFPGLQYMSDSHWYDWKISFTGCITMMIFAKTHTCHKSSFHLSASLAGSTNLQCGSLSVETMPKLSSWANKNILLENIAIKVSNFLQVFLQLLTSSSSSDKQGYRFRLIAHYIAKLPKATGVMTRMATGK